MRVSGATPNGAERAAMDVFSFGAEPPRSRGPGVVKFGARLFRRSEGEGKRRNWRDLPGQSLVRGRRRTSQYRRPPFLPALHHRLTTPCHASGVVLSDERYTHTHYYTGEGVCGIYTLIPTSACALELECSATARGTPGTKITVLSGFSPPFEKKN